MKPTQPPHTNNALPIITLTDDPEFRGILFGRYVDDAGNETGDLAVSVSKPGKTQLRGCVHIPFSRAEVIG